MQVAALKVRIGRKSFVRMREHLAQIRGDIEEHRKDFVRSVEPTLRGTR